MSTRAAAGNGFGIQTGNLETGQSLQEMFVQLSNTPGSSTDSKHAGWMDAKSVSWGVSQSTSAHTGGGSGVGRADFQVFQFIKYVDKATPNLMKHCASGKHLDQLVLSVCKAGGTQQEYLKVTLKEVFVTGVQLVSNTESPRMMEQVSLSYGMMTIEAKDQNADGSLGAAVTGAWDVKQNKAA
jgi:type VI secretion system secreted protein Hcp